jgi:hypothetical protein
MAGIGDEIGMRARQIGLPRLIAQFDERVILIDRCQAQFPDAARRRQPLDRHTAFGMGR